MNKLYEQPVPSTRTGPIYNAFSYPTKIDPEAIAVFIAAHTNPNGTVLDVFGGSGTTGVAAALCDNPTDRMRQLARQAGAEVKWGPRRAYVYEISSIGALVGKVLSKPPDPARFVETARELMHRASRDLGHLYRAGSPDGEDGTIRYVVWSELLRKPCCGGVVSLFDAVVSLAPASIAPTFECPACCRTLEVTSCDRILEEVIDEFTANVVRRRARVPAMVYGQTKAKKWSRRPVPHDLEVIADASSVATDWVPTGEIAWGDLYRSGYHAGIERYHHFYTRRNLTVVSRLWALASELDDDALREAIQILVLSYNASHSTLLTRVVAKRSQKDLVVTGAQSGVLYVSGMPVEKNVLTGVGRKIKTLADAFELTRGSESSVEVVCGSSTSLSLPDDSVDYVFTDPPFGAYIPYAEVNQVNEAWLGSLTDTTDEAIVSAAQGKTVTDYGRLVSSVFSEVSRVLRKDGRATVVFHASKPDVWTAIASAFRENNLEVEAASVLNKEQVSFKQVVSNGGTRGDAVFLLKPAGAAPDVAPVARESNATSLVSTIRELEVAAAGRPEELSPKRMWSRYVVRSVQLGTEVDISAPEFYSALDSYRQAQQLGQHEIEP